MKLRLKKKAPNGALRKLCVAIPEGPDEAHLWAPADREIMLEVVRHMLKGGYHSLSANQLTSQWVRTTIRVFATNVPGDIVRVFANPEVDITDYEQDVIQEDCASFRYSTARWRHRHLIIAAKSLGGLSFFLDTADPKFSEDVSLRLSYRIQHEMEHMDGINVRCEPEQMAPDEPSSPFFRMHVPES